MPRLADTKIGFSSSPNKKKSLRQVMNIKKSQSRLKNLPTVIPSKQQVINSFFTTTENTSAISCPSSLEKIVFCKNFFVPNRKLEFEIE